MDITTMVAKSITDEVLKNTILSLIKNDKFLFDYGKILSKSVTCEVVSKFTEKTLKVKNQFAGLATYKNFKIVQLLRQLEEKPEYIVFEDDIQFVKYPKITLDFLKIRNALISLKNDQDDIDSLELINSISIPDYYKQCKSPLYKGFNLSDKDYEKLGNNIPVKLENTKFSIWSERRTVTKWFSNEENKVIMTFEPNKEDILINVNLFLSDIFGDSPEEEKEIIVFNSPKTLTITLDNLLITANLGD